MSFQKKFSTKLYLLSIIIISLALALIWNFSIETAKAGTLTSATAVPANNNVDNLIGQTNATWRFTIDNDVALIASVDAVEITFPLTNINLQQASPWNFDNVTASTTAASGDLLAFATSTIWKNPETRKIILVVSTGQTSALNDFVIDIKGMVNPYANSTDVGSKNWHIRTCALTNAGDPGSGCNPASDPAPVYGAATLARRGGSISDWTITASNYSTSTPGVEFTASFTASTTLYVGDKIHFNFPVGFDLTNATTSDQTIVIGGAAQIASDAIATSTEQGFNQVILTISNGGINPAATSTVTFKVGNIPNPIKGSYQGFKIFTTIAGGGLVDGSFRGEFTNNDNSPPPVESIQIGGDNTIIGIVKVRRADGTLETVNDVEAAQLQVGMGCPDLQFFAGTKKVSSVGTFSYGNLISATYILFVMPFSNTNSSFFDNYLPPSMMQINVTGNETATATPTFEVPDGVLQGTITGGKEDGTETISVRAYTGAVESYSPIFKDPAYTNQGLSATGTGYFIMPIKTGDTWNITFETPSGTISSGGTQYWTPAVNSVFIPAGTATTTLSATSFVTADKTLNVTLRRSSDNSVIDQNTQPSPCLSVRRAGSDMMGPGGQGVCSTTLVSGVKVYQLKVPAGAFVIQLMMPGGFKEYPVTILSSDTTVSKTVVIQQATTYIRGTVTDPDSFPIKGASVMAQGSNGMFNQTLTDASGVYTLYAPAGTYRVEAFAPGYGPLTAIAGVIVPNGTSTIGQNFTIAAGGFKTIKGKVYTGATNYEGVQIHAYGSNGQNGTMTRSDGTYTLRVPAGTGYTIDAWSQTLGFIGSLNNIDVLIDNATGKDFTPAAQGYLQIKITNGNTYGISPVFAWAFNPATGKGNGSDTWTATTSNADLVTKFNLPAGTYRLDVGTPVFGNLTSLATNVAATTTTITADTVSNITIALPDLVTLSGTTRANATVWASRTDGPGKFNTTADSTTGAYSMKIPKDFNYMVGANLTGYTSAPVTLSAIAANTTQDLTLATSSDTISGTVTSGGTALSEGFVWAVRANNTGWMGAELSGDGTYSLAVDSGDWTVYATAPCKISSSGVVQTGAGNIISLTAVSGCSYTAPEMNSVVPTTGGVISQSDVSVNIPPNALGTGSTNVSVTVAKPSSVPPATLNAFPIGTSTKRILVTDSNGTAVTSLSNSIDISLTYSESDIPAGSENNLQLAYWDTTTNTWNPVAATLDTANNTLTAKVDHLTDFAPIIPSGEGAPTTPTGLTATKNGDSAIGLAWTQVSGATSYLIYRNTGTSGIFPYLATISSGSTVTYSSGSLSSNTAYNYKITASNSSGESAASATSTATTCSSITNGTVSGASCTLTCNSGYTNSNETCVASGGSVIMPSGGVGQTPAATPESKTTLPEIISETKEKITEVAGAASQAAKEFADKVIKIAADAAEIVKVDLNALLGKLGFKRDLAKEDVATKKYVKDLIKDAKGINKDKQNALTNFITYGTETTLKLGAGERAGVINSYKSAFSKLPTNENEWTDAIKIANGRWPSERNLEAEKTAKEMFIKVYLRKPNLTNQNDNAAITIITYGLRPANRNLASEAAAIKSFKQIYGHAPKSALAWDIVRAIAYSGAKR